MGSHESNFGCGANPYGQAVRYGDLICSTSPDKTAGAAMQVGGMLCVQETAQIIFDNDALRMPPPAVGAKTFGQLLTERTLLPVTLRPEDAIYGTTGLASSVLVVDGNASPTPPPSMAAVHELPSSSDSELADRRFPHSA